MNPLNVLRGGSLMTPAASLRRRRNEVLLDRNGRVCVQLDAQDRPIGVTLDGNVGAIAVADRTTGDQFAAPAAVLEADSRGVGHPRRTTPGGGVPDEDVDIVIAPLELKMRSAIALRSLSGNPIVLVDDLGRMAGLCGDDEIYRALLQQRRAAEGG